MKLLVCLKQILDPEISPRDFVVDSERRVAARGSASLVPNIFCENALETALQLRESAGGEIVCLTFGDDEADEMLRKALALRADAAYRIVNPGIEHVGSSGAATVLAAAAAKLGPFDLILLGREAGDWGEGQTAGFVAERLGLPCVSFVDRIEVETDRVLLHRQTDFGHEELSATAPLVVSITNSDSNVPRIPKTRDIMLAHRKELTTWSLDELGLNAEQVREAAAATEVTELKVPDSNVSCEFVSGDSLEERIEAFAERIAHVVRSV